ncbi:MAG: 16S rRNA (cytidine(1402)-2'-O)-methyltransferase [Myxococcota bacterium]|nr:16S rRNA (cytidine(1402)-2'-O)-methyltransferase [Myxococcota bacterium]
MLYVIATPIGNLNDLSPRARSILSECDVIFCEDTRHTRQLFSGLGLDCPRLESLHAHNESRRIPMLQRMWEEGKHIGLVSDAGTPAVSDPGRFVVSAAHQLGVSVYSIVGPSSLTGALAVSGFPISPFLFLGFPPRKTGPRRRWLIDASQKECTLVILESGRRIGQIIRDLKVLMPDREVTMCREMTKKYEEVRRMPVLLFPEDPVKGELVLVIGPGKAVEDDTVHKDTLKGIAEQLASLWGISKREAYNRLQRIK